MTIPTKKKIKKKTPQEIFYQNCKRIETFLEKRKSISPKEVEGYKLIYPERDTLIAYLVKGGEDIIVLRIETVTVLNKSDNIYKQLLKYKIIKE